MSSSVKDVFIVHTKGEEKQRFLVEQVISSLSEFGIEVWEYNDWSWETKRTDRNKKTYRSAGGRINLTKYMHNDPKPFYVPGKTLKVNRDELQNIIRLSKVVILIEPQTMNLSLGIKTEQTILSMLAESEDPLFPIILRFYWSGSTFNSFQSFPISFDYTIRDFGKNIPNDSLQEITSLIGLSNLVHILQCKLFRPIFGNYLINLAANENVIVGAIAKKSKRHRSYNYFDCEIESKKKRADLKRAAQSHFTSDLNLAESKLDVKEHLIEKDISWISDEIISFESLSLKLLYGGIFVSALKTLISVVRKNLKDAFNRFGYYED